MNSHGHDHGSAHQHHILPVGFAVKILLILLVLTVVTVLTARVDLGILNFPIAMLIATSKALLVVLFFMGLKYDNNENRIFFGTSFLFLGIFLVLTFVDLFFRPDWSDVRKNPYTPPAPAQSKFSRPWNPTPDVVAHGKALFSAQCASCHGDAGKGDGPAAAALNPRPRNFASGDGWKNPRKPTAVYEVVTKGLPGTSMSSFSTLPAEDRWALAHYVLSLGPAPGKDTAADFAKLGINPNQDASAGAGEKPSIPVDLAIEVMSEK